MKKRDPSQLHSVLIQVLKLLETLRLYADLLRDVADALSDAESSPAAGAAELAAAGCGPLRVRIASPAAAAQRAEGEREVLICGESSRGKKLWGSYCVNSELGSKADPRFGEFGTCSCLPLLPGFACGIHATWGPPFS